MVVADFTRLFLAVLLPLDNEDGELDVWLIGVERADFAVGDFDVAVGLDFLFFQGPILRTFVDSLFLDVAKHDTGFCFFLDDHVPEIDNLKRIKV